MGGDEFTCTFPHVECLTLTRVLISSGVEVDGDRMVPWYLHDEHAPLRRLVLET